jgi:hypothetical protein
MLKLAPRYAPKSLPKFLQRLCVLALLLPLAHGLADASPSGSPSRSSSASFKSGFSSQRSSSSSPSKGGFGSFGKRSSSSSSAPPPSRAERPQGGNGGFGSFGRGAAPDARRSDSALSQKLDRDAAEARALRTLDERRAAQAARNAPPPRYDDYPRQNNQPPGYANGPAPDYGRGQPPVIVRQDGGLGRVIVGAAIANAAAHAAANAANSHAQRGNGGAPMQPAPQQSAPSWNGGVDSVNAHVAPGGSAAAQPAQARGVSVFGTLVVLVLLALAGWAAYKWIMRARARRAADKPNYSFERN